MVPSIPSWYLKKNCSLGSKYLGGVASDRQAKLVASLSVIANVNSKLSGGRWTDNFNIDGALYGSTGFKSLPSYCQL